MFLLPGFRRARRFACSGLLAGALLFSVATIRVPHVGAANAFDSQNSYCTPSGARGIASTTWNNGVWTDDAQVEGQMQVLSSGTWYTIEFGYGDDWGASGYAEAVVPFAGPFGNQWRLMSLHSASFYAWTNVYYGSSFYC